jgi:uncharacterized damage-inducible protein DinB
MDADFFREVFDYSYWARDRVLGAAQGLSDEDYQKSNGFNYDGLRTLFAHAIAAESGYVARWSGVAADRITEDDVASLDALLERWREVESRMRAFVGSLADADLKREVVSQTRDGKEFRRTLAQDMFQAVNHGTQHRSEAAEALTRIGRSPGDLDFAVYLRSKL